MCLRYLIPQPTIKKYIPSGNKKAIHISAFSYNNAGDTVLPIVLRDLFNETIGVKQWVNQSVYKVVTDQDISKYNKADFLVIGGGGLFLKDTNPNDLSGWQWSCSVENLKKIKCPIIMFAVGYNRFRGQDDFEPIFKEHLNTFVEQAVFIGIRNHGSIECLKPYLQSIEAQKKLVFQPCMTTLIAKLYPFLVDYSQKEDFIAVNCAFDRESLRMNTDDVYSKIANVIQKLSETIKIKYYVHVKGDKKFMQFLDERNIEYEAIEFKKPINMLIEYAKPKLVIGMRGHAQMIPFGCKTPILSIVSHDKMRWFLEDIENTSWGVDVNDSDFENQLYSKSIDLYQSYSLCMKEIEKQQEKLWEITQNNLQFIKEHI